MTVERLEVIELTDVVLFGLMMICPCSSQVGSCHRFCVKVGGGPVNVARTCTHGLMLWNKLLGLPRSDQTFWKELDCLSPVVCMI